ncbi:MAG: ABC-type transport auxiliary lipoprotein family protein, partial [Candidatus Tenebribacter burtonii]|nr:ABC-type transport auxiliary lipoprotein family protein [Candidatus Tenebribacter burtonii]
MKKIIVLSLSIIFLFGCMARNIIPRNYYILEYYSHSEKDELKLNEPFNQSVYIEDTKVPRTYNRKQIVVRHFGPRITYSDNNLWGVKLTKIIPNLLKKRLDSYNMFKNTQRELFSSTPDYIIDTSINNIEMYISETLYQARLDIDFIYRKKDTEEPLITHSANIEKVLLKQDFDTFAQTINEILLDEIDKFSAKITILNTYGQQVPVTQENIPLEIDPLLVKILDSEEDNSGKGLLLVPAITGTENEPYYKVHDKYGYERSAKIGGDLPLMEGTYSIEYGSGNQDQKMIQKDIKIHPRYKTIVEPDWGCLIVEIIDESRNFAKVIYEIFGLEDGESFGSEFPSEVELGEQEKVWVLKPGYYKITINNEPFNTYTDFTTVLIEEGSVQKMTIVMETDEEGNPTNMAGAGILEDSFLVASLEPLKLSSAIHINGNLNSDNALNKDEPKTTITMNSQLENYLIYDKAPLYYNMKSVIDLGVSKTWEEQTDTDFRLASDEFDLKNTGIYYF